MGPLKFGAPGNCPICPPLKPALNTDTNNKLDDLMIMGIEKRRSKIYKSVV